MTSGLLGESRDKRCSDYSPILYSLTTSRHRPTQRAKRSGSLHYVGSFADDAKQARAILRLPSEQRRQALTQLTPDKQLDVYLYAATRVEPPLILANELAGNRQSILPRVKDRLASEVDERRLDGSQEHLL
jgi:hypothetical protein